MDRRPRTRHLPPPGLPAGSHHHYEPKHRGVGIPAADPVPHRQEPARKDASQHHLHGTCIPHEAGIRHRAGRVHLHDSYEQQEQPSLPWRDAHPQHLHGRHHPGRAEGVHTDHATASMKEMSPRFTIKSFRRLVDYKLRCAGVDNETLVNVLNHNTVTSDSHYGGTLHKVVRSIIPDTMPAADQQDIFDKALGCSQNFPTICDEVRAMQNDDDVLYSSDDEEDDEDDEWNFSSDSADDDGDDDEEDDDEEDDDEEDDDEEDDDEEGATKPAKKKPQPRKKPTGTRGKGARARHTSPATANKRKKLEQPADTSIVLTTV